jgi:hypothetical protein
MGWRFRQSFSIVPGLRLNLSKSGLSASIGSSPFTLNVGPHGLMGTASIPGTGLAALCECDAIWDVKTRQATDRYHELTTAVMAIGRERISFELGDCELIQWDQKVPHLRNAKGGELFLYPGFVLYRAAREAFSLIEYQEITGVAEDLAFQEDERVSTDTKELGSIWAKANKDGSRDRALRIITRFPSCVTALSS